MIVDDDRAQAEQIATFLSRFGISVVQEDNPKEPFAKGERVRVLTNGGRDRVTH